MNIKINTLHKKNIVWSQKDIDFLKYNTGKFSNTFIAKKLKKSLKQLYRKRHELGLTTRDCMIGHDYIIKTEVIDKLGLNNYIMNILMKNDFIKYKCISKNKNIGIPLEDVDRLEEFFKHWISFKSASRILGITSKSLQWRIKQKYNLYKDIELETIGKNTVFVKKNQIIEIRNLLRTSHKINIVVNEFKFDKEKLISLIKQDKIKGIKLNEYIIFDDDYQKLKLLFNNSYSTKEFALLLNKELRFISDLITCNKLSYIEHDFNFSIKRIKKDDYLAIQNILSSTYSIKEFCILTNKYYLDIINFIKLNNLVTINNKYTFLKNRIPKIEFDKFK